MKDTLSILSDGKTGRTIRGIFGDNRHLVKELGRVANSFDAGNPHHYYIKEALVQMEGLYDDAKDLENDVKILKRRIKLLEKQLKSK